MSDTPALDCLRTACQNLAEKNTSLRQWSVQQDGLQITVSLEWRDDEATLLVRGPEYPKSFGRTASFTFAIQMDEATTLMSHDIEIGLSQFIETVRKVDTGNIPLPVAHPTWEPGAGPPSEEPESEEPASEEPASEEPAVALDVVSNPMPQVNQREDWISEDADRAHAEHQDALNWSIFCALKMVESKGYPHSDLLGPVDTGPNADAHRFLVEHLTSGFSQADFSTRFEHSPETLCPLGFPTLIAFQALAVDGDRVSSLINHAVRLRVYQTFLYSPEVREALETLFRHQFDGRVEHMDDLVRHVQNT